MFSSFLRCYSSTDFGACHCQVDICCPEIGPAPLSQVPDEILIERVVGRRMDPETGKIYHMKYFPPPADIVDRLTQRSDDNEEAVSERHLPRQSDCVLASF